MGPPMPDRIELSDEQRSHLLGQEFLPASITINGKTYAPEAPIAAGYKGAVWRIRDEFGRRRAVKLCTYDDYQDRSYLQEFARASALEPYREFASPIDAGLVELTLGSLPAQKFVCFVEEWLDGLTLEAFCEKQRDLVTASFLLAYVKGVSGALSALRTVGLRHDDLHSGNVMLVKPVPGGLAPEWTIKVIDMGSLKPADSPTMKPKDDHRHFVDHLILLWNTVHGRRVLTGRDRRFLAEASHLLQSMLDDEPSIALREPAQIVQHFESAYTRASSDRPERRNGPSSPFEFISAEHIADDRLLVRLFARSSPFLDKVDGPDPCLVTGPRGCGKSMMFRWLSLKAHLHKPAKEIDEFRIAGFYVSCSSDLQNRLAWIRTAALAQRFRREIVHYFNLLLAREVFVTLSMIALRPDREAFWGFGLTQEEEICQFLLERLAPGSRLRIQGVSRLVQVVEAIEGEMVSTDGQILRGLNLTHCTSEAFLGDLTTLLAHNVSYFGEKRITFLIDDFSTHRLAPDVQVVLNQVIWERRPSHVFKLSSEKYGAKLTDAHGATIDVSREMVEIDCGKEYVALDDAHQVERARAFAVELLDNRLEAAGYAGTADVLIGPSGWPEGSLGRALAEKQDGRLLDQYHGLECVAGVCSGDISTLLLVYRRMFELGGVTSESTTRVPKHKQHDAITSVSRELFGAVKHHLPCGPEMYAVVASFGSLVRNILQHGRWQRKGTGRTPTQCPRIELDQKSGGAIETLTEEQQLLARELVRRAIFIEMEPGLSRHGNVTTLRWHLRRVYLPAFRAALAKNDAIKRQVDWLKYLLTNPSDACDMVWRTWPKDDPGQDGPTLFDEVT
jgi:hypothetical protein